MSTTKHPLPCPSPTQRRLIAWRVGRGMPLAEAATLAGMGADQAERLQEDHAFREQVASFRQSAAGSQEDRHTLLAEMASLMAEQAAAEGDPEAAHLLQQLDGGAPKANRRVSQRPAGPVQKQPVANIAMQTASTGANPSKPSSDASDSANPPTAKQATATKSVHVAKTPVVQLATQDRLQSLWSLILPSRWARRGLPQPTGPFPHPIHPKEALAMAA